MRSESEIPIKAKEWRLLDTANPAFRPADHDEWAKTQTATYKIEDNETAEQYWARVRKDITRRKLLEND